MRNELAKLVVVTYTDSFLIFFILDINECEFFPCENNGTCIDLIDQFTCQCVAGYTGDHCESSNLCIFTQCAFFRDFISNSVIDECASTPCQNNGTCIDGLDRHACLCLAGYTGVVCESCDLSSRNVMPCLILFF